MPICSICFKDIQPRGFAAHMGMHHNQAAGGIGELLPPGFMYYLKTLIWLTVTAIMFNFVKDQILMFSRTPTDFLAQNPTG
mgnify:CR=1 FL=1